jgi:hypothetical protein
MSRGSWYIEVHARLGIDLHRQLNGQNGRVDFVLGEAQVTLGIADVPTADRDSTRHRHMLASISHFDQVSGYEPSLRTVMVSYGGFPFLPRQWYGRMLHGATFNLACRTLSRPLCPFWELLLAAVPLP